MGRGTSKVARSTSGGGYKSFDDKPVLNVVGYSKEYEGTGQAQRDFFSKNSNCDELMDEITKNEQDRWDFYDWGQGKFMDGQQYRGWNHMTQAEQRRTRTYDKYLDRATLKEGVVLTRNSDAQLLIGEGGKGRIYGQKGMAAIKAMEGKSITCPANMSFSAASTGLNIGHNQKVTYKLKIKGGTKGAGMWIGDERINGWGTRQREFMTNRDSVFKVGKVKQDSSGHITVELEYQCGLEHDYGKK